MKSLQKLLIIFILIEFNLLLNCETNETFIEKNGNSLTEELKKYDSELKTNKDELTKKEIENFMDYYWSIPEHNLLGKGGFGEVKEIPYKRETSTEKIALKRIEIPEDCTEELITNQIEPIQKEINNLEFLNSKNPFYFPKLYDCIIDNKSELGPVEIYILQEKLFGDLSKNKQNFIDKTTPLERIKIYGDLFAALAVMHENNLVHSDIKPANLMAVDDDFTNLKFIDFGATNFVGSFIEAGSPAYNSPEKISFSVETLQPSQDIWALALTIANIESKGDFIFSGLDQKCFTKKLEGDCYSALLTNFGTVINQVFNRNDFSNMMKKMLSLDPNKRSSAAKISKVIKDFVDNKKDDMFLSSSTNHVFNIKFKDGVDDSKIVHALEHNILMKDLKKMREEDVVINQQGNIENPNILKKNGRIFYFKKKTNNPNLIIDGNGNRFRIKKIESVSSPSDLKKQQIDNLINEPKKTDVPIIIDQHGLTKEVIQKNFGVIDSIQNKNKHFRINKFKNKNDSDEIKKPKIFKKIQLTEKSKLDSLSKNEKKHIILPPLNLKQKLLI